MLDKHILGKITETEKFILINAFRHREARMRVLSLSEENFVDPFSKILLNSLRYFHPYYDKGEEFSTEVLYTQIIKYKSDATVPWLKGIFEGVEDTPNIHHHVDSMLTNRVRIKLLDGEVSLVDKLKEDVKNFYSNNLDALGSTIREIESTFNKLKPKGVLAKTINVEGYEKEIERRIKEKYFTTGFPSLDLALNYGTAPGKISVISGRTNQGKSVLASEIAEKIAISGYLRDMEDNPEDTIRPYSALYSLEMDEYSIIDRKVATMSNIPISFFTQQMYGDPHFVQKKIVENARKLNWNDYFFISDKGGLYYQDWIDDLKRIQDNIEQDYVVGTVDLFSKFKDFFRTDLTSPMVAEEIGGRLQEDAKANGFHFILVVQLNREGAFKKKVKVPADIERHFPKIEHIKNAGMYEEVADQVLMVQRPKKIAIEGGYEFADEMEDTLDISIVKQRGGKGAIKVKFLFEAETTKLSIPVEEKDIPVEEGESVKAPSGTTDGKLEDVTALN